MSETDHENDEENEAYLLGISVGWEQAADWLLHKAATAFRAGEDDAANLTRNWARQARQAASERRAELEAYRNREMPPEMKCPQCSKQLVGVEYAYNHPDHYDGVSEWACIPCGYHLGRWSGKLLGDGETEPKYGVRRDERTHSL